MVSAVGSSGLDLGPAVKAALVLAPSGPAPGTWVVAGVHWAGARPAANRRVPLRRERMFEQLMVAFVRFDVGVRPRRDRIDLHDAATDVEMHDRRMDPRRCLDPTQ